jgi:hypothetical protein
MWYITYDNWNGGLAHNFCDLLTSLVISKIFNIEYVHCEMYLSDKPEGFWGQVIKHMKNNNSIISKNNWERNMFPEPELLRHFFNFKGKNIKLEDFYKDNTNCKVVDIYNGTGFKFITLEEINNFLNKYDRNETILFHLTKNNRIWLWEFYDLCNRNIIDINLFNNIRNELKSNLNYKPIIQKNTLSIHIRKGDCEGDDINWSYNVLKNIQKTHKLDKINIYSMGSEEQMNQIEFFFNSIGIENIEYKFNIDTIQTIKEMMNSEILISSPIGFFSKTIGYFSDNIKFYDNDHNGYNIFTRGKLFQWEKYCQKPEIYDVKENELYDFSINMIKCDKNGDFNEEQFQQSLKHINNISL